MKTLIIAILAMSVISCASKPQPSVRYQLEREFGGIELGNRTTPLDNDIEKAITPRGY